MRPSTEGLVGIEGEDVPVFFWRYDRAAQLGYDETGCLDLAHGVADVHDVEALIGHGCPPELALEIRR